jgi:hypothetical protein
MLTLCPICSGEFYELEALCPACGCGLVPSTLEAEGVEAIEEYRQIRFVELCRPKLYPLAMLIKQTLETNGVPVIVKGGNSLSVLPHLAFSGELRVLVASDQLDFARELHHAYFEGSQETDYADED